MLRLLATIPHKVTVAFSGGVDSLVLAHFLKNGKRDVTLAHFNHGCEYSDQIIDEGFTDWNKPESHETVYYAEYNGHGDGYKPEKRAAYVHQLDEAQAAFYNIENVMHS